MSWEAWGDPPEENCQMCGHNPGSCVCEECTECGQVGDPECYVKHGMVETDEQIQGRIRHDPQPDDYM